MGLHRVGRTGSWRIRLVLLQGFAEDNDLGIGVAQHLNVRDGPVGVGTGSAFDSILKILSGVEGLPASGVVVAAGAFD